MDTNNYLQVLLYCNSLAVLSDEHGRGEFVLSGVGDLQRFVFPKKGLCEEILELGDGIHELYNFA
jgi:hypothetical protein